MIKKISKTIDINVNNRVNHLLSMDFKAIQDNNMSCDTTLLSFKYDYDDGHYMVIDIYTTCTDDNGKYSIKINHFLYNEEGNFICDTGENYNSYASGIIGSFHTIDSDSKIEYITELKVG